MHTIVCHPHVLGSAFFIDNGNKCLMELRKLE